MAGYRAQIANARERIFAPSVTQTVTRTTDDVVAAIGPQLSEIRRILGDQGDAADEVAEITGRTLARMAAEVTDLHRELSGLRAEVADLRSQLAALRDEGAAPTPPG